MTVETVFFRADRKERCFELFCCVVLVLELFMPLGTEFARRQVRRSYCTQLLNTVRNRKILNGMLRIALVLLMSYRPFPVSVSYTLRSWINFQSWFLCSFSTVRTQMTRWREQEMKSFNNHPRPTSSTYSNVRMITPSIEDWESASKTPVMNDFQYDHW